MANTYPFVVGKLPAADLNSAIASSRAVAAIKTADETVNNSASPQADDELTGLAFDAGVNYILIGWLAWTGVNNTAEFRQDFATTPGTTGATVSTALYTQGTAATTTTGTIETGPILDSSAAASSDHQRGAISGTVSGLLIGTLLGSTGSGTLVLRWAQGVAEATNLVLERGSWLMLIPVP